MSYTGILFSIDGDYVTDFPRNTKEEVIEELANRGSKWFFYPITGIIKNGGNELERRLVDVAFPFEHLKGKQVKTARKFLASLSEEEADQLLQLL